jgi:hypothetical protein
MIPNTKYQDDTNSYMVHTLPICLLAAKQLIRGSRGVLGNLMLVQTQPCLHGPITEHERRGVLNTPNEVSFLPRWLW